MKNMECLFAVKKGDSMRKIFRKKRAVEMVPSLIIVFVILLVVLTVMIFIFRNYIGKETDIINEQISSFEDCDCDGISNFLDKCPCDPFKEGDESEKYTVCPSGKDPTPCNKQECENAKSSSFRCS